MDEYARNIAASLNEMKPAEFAAMLRDLKRAKKSTLPFEARKTAAAELFPRAIGLVHKKKAPVHFDGVHQGKSCRYQDG